METLYRRKRPIVSVRVSGISSGHLTGSVLVKTCRKISLNSVQMSRMRAAGIVGWCMACDLSRMFTYSVA